MAGKKTGRNSSPVGDRLLSLIERVEYIDEEIAKLRLDRKEILLEAKSAGFDMVTFRQMLRERKMTTAELEERVALAEIYRKALGMLEDTPLGDAALKRLNKPPEESKDPAPKDQAPEDPAPDAGDAPNPETAPTEPQAPKPPTQVEIEAARQAGIDAQNHGEKVTANPYPFGDPRRAAWDSGWCSAAGSDGMDIPPAWRRSKKDDKEGKK